MRNIIKKFTLKCYLQQFWSMTSCSFFWWLQFCIFKFYLKSIIKKIFLTNDMCYCYINYSTWILHCRYKLNINNNLMGSVFFKDVTLRVYNFSVSNCYLLHNFKSFLPHTSKKWFLCIHSTVKIDNILLVWRKNSIANYNLKNKVWCLHLLYASVLAPLLRLWK